MATTPGNSYRDRLVHAAANHSDGFPFIVQSDWVPGAALQSTAPKFLPLQKGDEGVLVYHDPAYLSDVARYVREEKTIWVWVIIKRRGGQIVDLSGNVPKSYLKMGTERRCDERITQFVGGTATSLDVSGRIGTTSTLPTGDVVFRTICQLMDGIKSRAQQFEDFTPGFLDLLGVPGNFFGIVEVANILTTALKRTLGVATYDKLCTDNFTWSDIKKSGIPITKNTRGGGIYCWTHSNFNEDSKKVPAIAIGSTDRFSSRFQGHHSAFVYALKQFNDKTVRRMSPQYDAWRRTGKHEMVALALLDENVSADHLLWYELLLIMLFESYHPAFYTSNQTGVQIPEATEAGRVDTDMKLDDLAATAIMPTTTDQPAVTRSIFTSTMMQAHGTKLATLGRKVFTITGWPGGCKRSRFAASGTNWHTPGTGSGGQGLCFTKMVVPGVMDTYRKHTQKASNRYKKNGRDWIGINNVIEGVLNINLPRDDAAKVGIAHGTRVHFIFEIMHSGRHRYPWARLPEVPEFADDGKDNIANRLGVRLEWQYKDKGKLTWGRVYVQSPLKDEHAENRPSRAYTIAIAIIRCLQLQTLDRYPDWWLRTSRSIYVREVKFDWLRQVLTIQDRRSKTVISAPVQIPTSVRMEELVRRGARNIGPRVKSGRGKGGARCDNCLLHSMDWDGEWFPRAKGPANKDLTATYHCKITTTGTKDAPRPCKRCGDLMRLFCSFSTNNQDPLELPEALRAGLVSTKAQVSLLATFEVMSDPGLQPIPSRSQAATSSVLASSASAPTAASSSRPAAPAVTPTAARRSIVSTNSPTTTSSSRPAAPAIVPTLAPRSTRSSNNPTPHVSLPANPFAMSAATRGRLLFGSSPATATSTRPAVTPVVAPKTTGTTTVSTAVNLPHSNTTPATVPSSRSAAPTIIPASARTSAARSKPPVENKKSAGSSKVTSFFLSASDRQTVQHWDTRIPAMIADMNTRHPEDSLYQPGDWLALYDVERQLRDIPSNGPLSQNRSAWLATVTRVLDERLSPFSDATDLGLVIERRMQGGSIEGGQRAVVAAIRGVRHFRNLQHTSSTTARRALIALRNRFANFVPINDAYQTAVTLFLRLLAHALQQASQEFELELRNVVTLRSRLPTVDEIKQAFVKNQYNVETMSDILLWLQNMAVIFNQDMSRQIKVVENHIKSKK